MADERKVDRVPPADEAKPGPDTSIAVRAEYSGPLPPPAAFEHYERILPGAAERISSMAEKQQLHVHAITSQNLSADISDTRLGQWFGFLTVCACLGTSAWLGYIGQPWLGGVIGLGGITGLVSVFVWDRRGGRRDN